jgi:putative two-component system response regulator
MPRGDGKQVVLIVDDDEKSREIIRLLLQQEGYVTLEVGDGKAAMDLIRTQPPDLVLLDITMPGISGFEVVKQIKQDDAIKAIPVIMVTGLGDRESRLRALKNGAEDYLMKPLDPAELRMRTRNHLRLKEYGDLLSNMNRELEKRVRDKTSQLQDSHRQTIFLLTSAAEYRDEDTGAHVKRISCLTAALSRTMGMDEDFIDAIFYASPMHDIGKIGIPDSILLKPAKLSPAEWETMKTHPTLGEYILRSGTSPYIRMGALIAKTHHECWDGSGYPEGLKGEEIPMPGRIMLLCDQYDALRSRRPYKGELDHESVMNIIIKGDGRTRPDQFCPSVLKAFSISQEKFASIYAQDHEYTKP